MITLHQLRVLSAVAKRLNLSEAGRALGVTQTAVSHTIKGLENQLEIKLIKKVRTGVELTEVGEAFRTGVENILNLLDDLMQTHSTKKTQLSAKNLTIGASHGPSSHLVPSLLTRFQRNFPLLHIVQRTGTSAEIEELLLKRSVEIAFISNPSNRPGLTSETFTAERLIFVVAKSHRMAKQTKITKSSLAYVQLLIDNGKDGKGTTIKILRQRISERIKLNVAMEFDNPEALKSAIRTGGGVGLLYADMVSDELRDGGLKELTLAGVNLNGNNHLVYLKDAPISLPAMKFLEFARSFKNRNGSLRIRARSQIKQQVRKELR